MRSSLDEREEMLENRSPPPQIIMSYTDREKHRKMKILVIVSVSIIIFVSAAYTIGILVPRIIYWTTPQYPPTCNYSIIYTGTGVTPTQEIVSGILLSIGSNNVFIALDAGSLLRGVRIFVENNGLTTANSASSNADIEFNFPSSYGETQRIGMILQNQLIGYFFGTSDFTHIMGFISQSPFDRFDNTTVQNSTDLPSVKSIIGSESVLSTIRNQIFIEPMWALINNYQYITVTANKTYYVNDLLQLPNNTFYLQYFSGVQVTVYQTCNGNNYGNAYLFNSKGSQLLYLSQTGGIHSGYIFGNATCDWRANMNIIWNDYNFLPNNLTAIFVEVSSGNSEYFGFLTPSNLIETLATMMSITKVSSIANVKVYIQPVQESYGAVDTAQNDITEVLTNLSEAQGVDAQFNFQNQGDYLCI